MCDTNSFATWVETTKISDMSDSTSNSVSKASWMLTGDNISCSRTATPMLIIAACTVTERLLIRDSARYHSEIRHYKNVQLVVSLDRLGLPWLLPLPCHLTYVLLSLRLRVRPRLRLSLKTKSKTKSDLGILSSDRRTVSPLWLWLWSDPHTSSWSCPLLYVLPVWALCSCRGNLPLFSASGAPWRGG